MPDGDRQPVVMITGSSRGLGRDLAARFALSGWIVAGCSRGPATLAAPSYHHTSVDITDEAQVRQWVSGVRKAHGGIDALVCNAGLVKSTLLAAMTPGSLHREFLNTIALGTMLVCGEVAKVMARQGAGRIVTIGSTMTAVHEPGTSGYAAAKAAVVEYTKVLARELAPRNVTCNVVAPSLIETDSSREFGAEWRERMLALQTLRRPVDGNEIFEIIAFLVGPAGGCLTGQVLHTCMVD